MQSHKHKHESKQAKYWGWNGENWKVLPGIKTQTWLSTVMQTEKWCKTQPKQLKKTHVTKKKLHNPVTTTEVLQASRGRFKQDSSMGKRVCRRRRADWWCYANVTSTEVYFIPVFTWNYLVGRSQSALRVSPLSGSAKSTPCWFGATGLCIRLACVFLICTICVLHHISVCSSKVSQKSNWLYLLQ